MFEKMLPKTTKQLTVSAMVIALYVVILYLTQGISFGAIQCRIATALYALAFPFPFLVIPLGVANFIANFMGGMGVLDIVGGSFVGSFTAFLIALLRFAADKAKSDALKSVFKALVLLPILVIPSTIVPLWLTTILSSTGQNVTYFALCVSLGLGQAVPAVLGSFMVFAFEKRFSAMPIDA